MSDKTIKVESSTMAKHENDNKISRLLDLSALFVSLFLLGFMLYLKPGMDNIIDLMNYHAYNGWAITSGEWWNHFHPGFIHHYILAPQQVLNWMLLDTFNIEWAIGIMTLIHLSVIVPIYLFVRQIGTNINRVRAAWISVLSVSTITFLPFVGDFNGDILTFIPMMYAIWLLAKFNKETTYKALILSAVLAGLSVSMKLTNVIYAPLVIALLLLSKKLKPFIIYSISIAASFLVFVLPQSITILINSKTNPVFPFYNNIFKSPYAEETAFSLEHYKLPVNEILKWMNNFFVSPNLNDLRPVILTLTVLSLALTIILNKKELYNDSSKNTIFIYYVFIAGLIGSLLFHAMQFGLPRYSVGLWLLLTPGIFLGITIMKEYLPLKQYKNTVIGLISLVIVTILAVTVNPTSIKPHQIPTGEKMFQQIDIPQIQKYDAIILPGPGVSTWLALLTRDHIKESGQLWLSTAFNREDARRADEMLSSKNLNNVGYITAVRTTEYVEKNLNTLGFTDGGNCTPVNISKYGYWYEYIIVCDASYTGKYSYTLENLEDKTHGGGEASIPLQGGVKIPKEYISFRD